MKSLLLFVLLGTIAVAHAQSPHPHHAHAHGASDAHHPSGHAETPAPVSHAGHGDASEPDHHAAYAGLQTRRIKALSEQQIEDLKAGRGMSMALPAELNGYPGPVHTLELAGEIGLTPDQERRTRALFSEMQREAGSLGERLIAAEDALDRLFREQEATPDNVMQASLTAAEAQGRLRATHLLYHLRMLDVLSAEQIEHYNTLRGYR